MVKKVNASTDKAPKSQAKASQPRGVAGAAAAAMQGLQGLQGMLDKQMPGAVKDSAQQIWLAGMGAFSKMQADGGKIFETLVTEGLNLQKKTQAIAEEKISEVTGKMSSMAGTVTAKAGENWDRLETIFEARTAKAMNKLGVPTAKDLDALAERVDALAAAVAKLSKGTNPASATKSARPVAKAVTKAVTKSVTKAASKAKAGVKSAAEVFAVKAPAKRSRKSA